MSGGLIINSPLRHLGVQEHGEEERQEKPSRNPKKRRAETGQRNQDPAARKMVRKDRKICRGRFFIRRKNCREEDAPSQESSGTKTRNPRRSARPDHKGPRSQGFRKGNQSRGTTHRPLPQRGVPYHLRKPRPTAAREDGLSEEVHTA